MRVLIAGTTYFPALNGMAIFMTNLAEGLARAGHEVAVLFPDHKAYSKTLNGVRLEALASLGLDFLHSETYIPLPSRKVARVFDSFRPEIVHVQDHYPLSGWTLHQARKRGIPVIGTNHFGPAVLIGYVPGSRFIRPLLDRIGWNWILSLYNRTDYVVAPSQTAVNGLQANGLRVPALALSCGTDLGRFQVDPTVDRRACRLKYGLDPDRTLFVYVGRIDPEKRVDVLVNALGRLQRDDLQLVIAGEGISRESIRALTEQLDLGNRVRFLGRLLNEELPRLLNSADAFAMAGEVESLSLSTLEAMACGLPVLLANAGALPELVTPGVNGYSFRAGDAADAARFMAMLADHPEQRRAMGRASVERARAHSLDFTLERYEVLYRQVVANAAQASLAAAGRHVRTRTRPADAKRDL